MKNFDANTLHEYKDLFPDGMKIHENRVIVKSVLDFRDVGRFFAFLHVVEKCRYTLYAEKEDLLFDGNEEGTTEILVVAHFLTNMAKR